MDYILAKRLKDAGFPQPPTQEEISVDKSWVLVPVDEQERGLDKFYYCPTLSELIELCGDNIMDLSRTDDGWMVNMENVGDLKETQGKTPEIAVANLWLELNKKI